MSQPEWMEKFNKMGLKRVPSQDGDNFMEGDKTGDGEGEGEGQKVSSRFEKFEHKTLAGANNSTPPWMQEKMQKRASGSAADPQPPITRPKEEDGDDMDAAALFASAGSAPPVRRVDSDEEEIIEEVVVEDAQKEEDIDDAAALFAAAGTGPPVSPQKQEQYKKIQTMLQTDMPKGMIPLNKKSLDEIVPVAPSPGGLSPEEEETALRYEKMLKMGMPEGAVIQKMQVEEVPQHVQDKVLNPEPEPEGINPVPGSEEEVIEEAVDDESIEEEIIEEEEEEEVQEEVVDDSVVEESVLSSTAVEESAATSGTQDESTKLASAAPILPSSDEEQKMTDEEFGEPWVVNRDKLLHELSTTKFDEVEVEREDGNVHYEEIFLDENGNEVVVPMDTQRYPSDAELEGPIRVELSEIFSPAKNENEGVEMEAVASTPRAREPPQEQPRDPAFDVENQKKMLNRGSKEYRSKMAQWVPYTFFFGVVAAVVLVLFFVILADEDGIDVNSIPTASPTPQDFIPLEPTDPTDVAATTPLDPITANCDFSDSNQPHVITQCACTGGISILADDIRARYESLRANFIETLIPDFSEEISSCDASNQALVWLSTGTNNAGESQPFVRRQRYALAFFFMDQGGIAWSNNDSWISELDACTWSGVSCDSNGRVLALDVSNNRVIGQLSTSLALLEFLQQLNASRNRMEGKIPSDIVDMLTLRALDLSSNSLSGDIPNFPTESRLEIVNLAENNFSEGIPTSFGNLKALASLNLAGNSFAGGIPSELFALPLQELYLQNNLLSGTIPSAIANLSLLKTLTLGPNSFTGDIPDAIGGLSSLTQLIIEDVPELGGRLPASFGIGLTNLVEFVLKDTSVRGNIPEQFGRMIELQRLEMPRNSLGRALPPELGALTNLRFLDLEENTFTGLIPEQLGNAIGMIEMKLNRNQLVGSVPSSLGRLTNLVTLNLQDNFLDGRAPEELCSLRQDDLEEFTVDCPSRVNDVLVIGVICSIPSCCTECF